MAKPLGVRILRVRHAPNQEWGIWYVNEEGCPYLLLTDPDIEDIVELGDKLARALGLSCKIDRSEYYSEAK